MYNTAPSIIIAHKCVLLFQSSKQKGPLNSKQKRSIFAVPDSLSGRVRSQDMFIHVVYYNSRQDVYVTLQVGVGTCNVGGKGMTDFETRKKYSKS